MDLFRDKLNYARNTRFHSSRKPWMETHLRFAWALAFALGTRAALASDGPPAAGEAIRLVPREARVSRFAERETHRYEVGLSGRQIRAFRHPAAGCRRRRRAQGSRRQGLDRARHTHGRLGTRASLVDRAGARDLRRRGAAVPAGAEARVRDHAHRSASGDGARRATAESRSRPRGRLPALGAGERRRPATRSGTPGSAVAGFKAVGDGDEEAVAAYVLGRTRTALAEFPEAHRRYTDALELWRREPT